MNIYKMMLMALIIPASFSYADQDEIDTLEKEFKNSEKAFMNSLEQKLLACKKQNCTTGMCAVDAQMQQELQTTSLGQKLKEEAIVAAGERLAIDLKNGLDHINSEEKSIDRKYEKTQDLMGSLFDTLCPGIVFPFQEYSTANAHVDAQQCKNFEYIAWYALTKMTYDEKVLFKEKQNDTK